LAPISQSQPCGLSKDSGEDIDLLVAFSNLQIAGDTSRKIERLRADIELLSPAMRAEVIRDNAGRAYDPMKDPEWSKIVGQCCAILEAKSKDMRVVSWLIEAMAREYGFEGLSEALDVTGEMIKAFGSSLYPTDSDAPNYAIGFIDKLNQSSSLLQGLSRVTISSELPISFSSKLVASHLKSLPDDQREDLRATGLMTYDELEVAINRAEVESVRTFVASLDSAIKSVEHLNTVLAEASGESSYGFGGIKKELESMRDWFQELLRGRIIDGDDEEVASELLPIEATDDSAPEVIKGNDRQAISLKSREDALNSLLKVASFFRRTEPHSPLSYSLEQAVRWGKMPLPDLLRELVPSDEVLNEVYRRMGIQGKPAEPNEQEEE
jgi:type VI secretion system protein ImpA